MRYSHSRQMPFLSSKRLRLCRLPCLPSTISWKTAVHSWEYIDDLEKDSVQNCPKDFKSERYSERLTITRDIPNHGHRPLFRNSDSSIAFFIWAGSRSEWRRGWPRRLACRDAALWNQPKSDAEKSKIQTATSAACPPPDWPVFSSPPSPRSLTSSACPSCGPRAWPQLPHPAHREPPQAPSAWARPAA